MDQTNNYDSCEVVCIRKNPYGEFYRDDRHGCVDWRLPGGDEMSMTMQNWIKFVKDLPEILQKLGRGVKT